MAALILIALLVLAYLCIAGRIKSGTLVQKALLALDILLSTLIWGAYDITISSRCGLYLRKGSGPWLWMLIGRGLNQVAKGHTENAIVNDTARLEAAKVILQS